MNGPPGPWKVVAAWNWWLPREDDEELTADLRAHIQNCCAGDGVINGFSRRYVAWMSPYCRCYNETRVEKQCFLIRGGLTGHRRRRGPSVGGRRQPSPCLPSRSVGGMPQLLAPSLHGAPPRREACPFGWGTSLSPYAVLSEIGMNGAFFYVRCASWTAS
jgi:hypothetical protein